MSENSLNKVRMTSFPSKSDKEKISDFNLEDIKEKSGYNRDKKNKLGVSMYAEKSWLYQSIEEIEHLQGEVKRLQWHIDDRGRTMERQGKMIVDYEAGSPEMVERLRWKLAGCNIEPETSDHLRALEKQIESLTKKRDKLQSLLSDHDAGICDPHYWEPQIKSLIKERDECKAKIKTLEDTGCAASEFQRQKREKLEAENAELLKLLPEWGCDQCKKAFPRPITLNLMCPENCGGTLLTSELSLTQKLADAEERAGGLRKRYTNALKYINAQRQPGIDTFKPEDFG